MGDNTNDPDIASERSRASVVEGLGISFPVTTIGDLFDTVAGKWANRTAIVFYGRKFSFRELREKVDKLAGALMGLGVRKGDRIAMMLLNSPEYAITFFAAAKIGAVVTPISPVYVSSEVKHQLEDSGARVVVCMDMLYETIEKSGVLVDEVILVDVTESLPLTRKLFGKSILRNVYTDKAKNQSGHHNNRRIHRIGELISRSDATPPRVDIDPERDLIALPYTGGTTGAPKGVQITHHNVVANLLQLNASLPCLEEGKETSVSYMPFYHAAGQSLSLILCTLNGYTQVVLTTPDLDEIVQAIIRYGATFFVGAPAIYESLKDFEKSGRIDWRRLKVLICGADALHEHTANEWKTRWGVTLTEGYGMTETTGGTHMNPLGAQRVGSVGKPMAGVSAVLLDPDVDAYAAPGEKGEIGVRGPQVGLGYWKRPEATRECQAVIEGITWWRTGDIARVDDDGYFYFYERKRDLIKYKGLRVFAREVEEVLMAHPMIKSVGVVGVPDQKVGENVKAVIVLETDAHGLLTEGQILEFCEDKLAHYKIPRIIEFVGEIPRTDIGKVSRREIREETQ